VTGEVTLSIIFKILGILGRGKAEDCVLDCKKNFQNLMCSSFLHQCNFGLLVSFPNFFNFATFLHGW